MSAARWIVAAGVALLIVGLLAYARGEPGAGGRSPDREHATLPATVADEAGPVA